MILVLLLLSALPSLLRWTCNVRQLLFWAPGICLKTALSPGISQVSKTCFISHRHVFMLEKAGQRTDSCVWNRRCLDLSWSLFYWWNEFTASVPRKSSLPERDLLFFHQRTALHQGNEGLDCTLHLWWRGGQSFRSAGFILLHAQVQLKVMLQ